MPAIGSGDIAGIDRPGVRRREQPLQPLNIGNGLLDIHLGSVYVRRLAGEIPVFQDRKEIKAVKGRTRVPSHANSNELLELKAN